LTPVRIETVFDDFGKKMRFPWWRGSHSTMHIHGSTAYY